MKNQNDWLTELGSIMNSTSWTYVPPEALFIDCSDESESTEEPLEFAVFRDEIDDQNVILIADNFSENAGWISEFSHTSNTLVLCSIDELENAQGAFTEAPLASISQSLKVFGLHDVEDNCARDIAYKILADIERETGNAVFQCTGLQHK